MSLEQYEDEFYDSLNCAYYETGAYYEIDFEDFVIEQYERWLNKGDVDGDVDN